MIFILNGQRPNKFPPNTHTIPPWLKKRHLWLLMPEVPGLLLTKPIAILPEVRLEFPVFEIISFWKAAFPIQLIWILAWLVTGQGLVWGLRMGPNTTELREAVRNCVSEANSQLEKDSYGCGEWSVSGAAKPAAGTSTDFETSIRSRWYFLVYEI